MTHGSLFTGIGGFDLGFERAGLESVWQVEIDEKAEETLSVTFPNVERFTDVRKCKGLKSVDVITGGFPCQDLSVAGRRAGLTGERSGLWFDFHRILADIKPRWVVVENVPGLLSSNKGRDFAVILRGLVELGYGVCWRVLDAQYFGLAQRRKRVFIVGSLGDYSSRQVLFESESVSGNSAKSRKAGSEVAYTIRANPSHSGDKGDGGINTTLIPDQTVATPITATYANTRTPNDTQTGRPSNLVVNCLNTDPYADQAAEETKLVVAATLNNGDHEGGFRTEPGEHLVASYWDGGQLSDTLDSSSISKQQTQPEKRRFPAVLSQGVRRLTPVECEKLQGFDPGWTGMHKDTVRYRQIGNAVAVPVAEWIGKRIMRVENADSQA